MADGADRRRRGGGFGPDRMRGPEGAGHDHHEHKGLRHGAPGVEDGHLGKVAISVPATWQVKHDTNCAGTEAPGVLLLGEPKVLQFCPAYVSAPNVVTVTRLPAGAGTGGSSPGPKAVLVNGVPVDIGFGSPSELQWTVPSLGVEITGTGPLTRRILATLRRS